MSARRGEDELSFADAIEQEEARLAGEVERVLEDAAYFSRKLKRYSYVTRGYYDEQVERWLSLLPREQLLVLASEAFFARPDEAYQRVLEFLGLEPMPLRDAKVVNPGSGDGALDAALRERLAAHFAPHNERLFELLGERFDWT